MRGHSARCPSVVLAKQADGQGDERFAIVIDGRELFFLERIGFLPCPYMVALELTCGPTERAYVVAWYPSTVAGSSLDSSSACLRPRAPSKRRP
jgi:hypothetical protein